MQQSLYWGVVTVRAVRAGCSLLHALSWLQVGVFISGPLARALPRESALASGQCCSPPSVSEDNGTLRAAAVWARNFSTFPPEQQQLPSFEMDICHANWQQKLTTCCIWTWRGSWKFSLFEDDFFQILKTFTRSLISFLTECNHQPLSLEFRYSLITEDCNFEFETPIVLLKIIHESGA